MFTKTFVIASFLISAQVCVAYTLNRASQDEATAAVEEAKQASSQAINGAYNKFEDVYNPLVSYLEETITFHNEFIQNTTTDINKLIETLIQEAEEAQVDVQKCFEVVEPLEELGNKLRETVKQCYLVTGSAAVSTREVFHEIIFMEESNVRGLDFELRECKDEACYEAVINKANDIKNNVGRDLENIVKVPISLVDRLRQDNGYCYVLEQVNFYTTTQDWIKDITECAKNIIG